MTRSTPAGTVLSTRSLRVGYDGASILPPIEVTVHKGQFWALVGANGSGKTTLLRTILGLLPPVAGELAWSEDAVISYVAQRSDFDPSVPGRVRDFVLAGFDRGWSFARWRHRDGRLVDEALERARCRPLREMPFANLSEGQKARVRLARALVSRPNVLVLDEPTSSVDPVSEQAIFDTLAALREEHGVTLIVVSHRTPVFVERATHALFMERDDHVAIAGTFAEVVRTPSFLSRHGPVSGHAYELPTSPASSG